MEELVVTGSRIVRDGFAAPTPVTVVQMDRLQNAAPTNVADALNQLPQFANSSKPSNAGPAAGGNNGGNYLNLRGLGESRTLVLIDGRRGAPSNNSSATDTNLIPQSLISRVDVVTGGASAAYGSDAVAGVVNFVLDTKFNGLKLAVQGGQSTYQDDTSYKGSITWGAPLFDGRGHLVVSVEHSKREGFDYSHGRDWVDAGWGIITNPNAPPSNVIVPGVRFSSATYGGLITGPTALSGIEFLPGGVPDTFNYGTFRTTSGMVGGDGPGDQAGLPAALRYSTFFAHLTYDFTDSLSGFIEASLAESRTNYVSTNVNLSTSNAFTIYRDNAYLPQSIADEMDLAGVTSFSLGRINRDFKRPWFDNLNDTYNVTAGLNGAFNEDWSFDGYVSTSRNAFRILTISNVWYEHVYNAADAVEVGGDIICRSTLTYADNGCVPINLFGEGSPSPEAIDYVTGTQWARQVVKQDVAAFNVAGQPFSWGPGAISLAAGVEYRKVSSEIVSDAVSQSFVDGSEFQGLPTGRQGQLGGWNLTNTQPASGKYDIIEGYLETAIPLAREAPFAYAAELNAAVRYTDYSLSGAVTTWKVGLTYSPIEEVRLRATRSRDIRAANFGELFAGARQSQGFVRDPEVGGAQARYTGRSVGNANLVPEVADTLTFGVVYQPFWWEGFSASIDAYQISIADVIAVLGAQEVIDACFAGEASQCALVERDSSDVLVAITTPYQNAAKRELEGVDFEATWRTPAWGGNLTLRALASYIDKLETTIGSAGPTDRAGDLGRNQEGVPKWTTVISADFSRGPFTLYVQDRYLADGKFDSTLGPAQINDNDVDSVSYFDVTGRYRFEVGAGEYEAFITINNLFNADPPIAPARSTATWYATNPSLYDQTGRYYVVGARVKF